MFWPRRTFTLHDGKHGCRGRFPNERNCASKNLDQCQPTVSPRLARGVSTTYIYHDHSEGENISFFAIRPILQNLWRRVPRGVTIAVRGTLYGVQVLRYQREAEICDAGVSGVVHEDILLVGVNTVIGQDLDLPTPLRSPWITLQECR
jgi:hypothetical protein